MVGQKRIAIIGAGICGMTSAKACLEENFEPVVFEKTNYTGGLWRYQPNLDVDGIASVMKSTVINTSKELSAFSDYPPPIELSNYMHNTKIMAYFDSYAAQFNFLSYVRFRQEVKSLELADDFETTGRWKLTAKSMETGDETTEIFDGVMICVGHHSLEYMAKFPDQEKFKGKIMHTHSLKGAKGFDDRTVVIVGIGNSAGDAAVELATVTKQIYLSTRRGSWIGKRVGGRGEPSDTIFLRRYFALLMKYLPYDWVCSYFEKYVLNDFFDHGAYQIKPKHRCFSQHIAINDALPNRILSGTVTVKGDIERFTEDGVIFKGESNVTKCDTVIMATGYRIHYPFLSQEILPVVNNAIRLYKFQFIPHLKPAHTLAFIGLIQPIGAIFPIAELQARWYAQLMSGNCKLPDQKAMDADIDRRLEAMRRRYYGSNRHTIQVDWIPFLDELAQEIGAYPPVLKYLFTDPKLFWALFYKPSASYQYRLVGPHSWKGAREAQLGVEKRIKAALKTNKCPPTEPEEEKSALFSFPVIVLVLLSGLTLMFFAYCNYF